MKAVFIVLTIFFATSITSAQTPATAEDSMQIREACSNYVGGFYNADYEKVTKAVHPELVKRIVNNWNGDYNIGSMGASQLIGAAKNFKKPADPNPAEAFKLDITIYDIS